MKHLRYALIAFGLLFASQADAATCFWVGGTGTWSTANTASWASSSGGTAGTCAATGGIPKQSADTATFDGSSGGGTVTVDSTINGITLTQITMGAFTGTLDFSVNNPSLTMQVFSNTGSGTRTLNLGSGTFTITTLSGTNNCWDFTTTTGLTFNAGTSTIAVQVNSTSSTNKVFVGGSKTYHALTVSGGSNPSEVLAITGSNTFSSVGMTAPVYVQFPSAATTTITAAFTWAGTSGTSVVQIGSTSGNSAQPATISTATGTATCTWCAFQNVTFSGGATFTATNSFDLKGNTGITISGPSVGGGGHIIGG